MNWSRNRTVVVLLASLVAAGCGSEPEERPVPEASIVKAQTALAPLKLQLMGALSTALSEGGPEQAIEVCQGKAPGIAKEVAGEGVEIGRTSHRLRNPDNAPREWVKPLLDEYVAGTAGEGPRAVRLADGRTGYVEPIRMKKMCLSCHGTAPAPPITAKLAELYPEDRATGFAEGDFRGLFWVELAAAAGGPS